MRNYNVAPDFDWAEDDDESQVAPRSRPNVPPYYTVRGSNSGRANVPPPLPTGQIRRPPLPQGTRPTMPLPDFGDQPTRALPVRRVQPNAPQSWLAANWQRLVVYVAAALIASILAYWLISNALHWWQTWQDDMTYGRPRTMQVDQFVGHNEQDGTPSHFIAQNNNRQVTVIEYPGGDVTKTRVFQGPRLFGRDSELIPVKIQFQDVNGDGHVDMLLNVDNQLVVFVNQDGTFRPITPDERAKLKITKGS